MAKPDLIVIPGGKRKEETGEDDLRAEVRTALRSSLALVMDALRSAEGMEVTRLAGVAARLCDSITRGLLAGQKLDTGDSEINWLRSEFKRVLGELKKRRDERLKAEEVIENNTEEPK